MAIADGYARLTQLKEKVDLSAAGYDPEAIGRQFRLVDCGRGENSGAAKHGERGPHRQSRSR
jgi:hypothetical protein